MSHTTAVARASQSHALPVLVRYQHARTALAAAKQIDEVKEIRDRAVATKLYAQQAKDRSLEIDAAEIRVRAERRLGELIQDQKETVGLNRGGRPKQTGSLEHPVPADARPTLAEAGIDKGLADRARKLAVLTLADFEARIEEWRDRVSRKQDFVKTNVLPEDREQHARYMKRHRKAVSTGDFIEQENGRRMLTDVPRCYSCGKPAHKKVLRMVEVDYCGGC